MIFKAFGKKGALLRGTSLVLGASIPVTVALDLILGVLFLPLGWIVDGGYKAKFRQISGNPVTRAALLFFVFLLLSALWSRGGGARNNREPLQI